VYFNFANKRLDLEF